MNVKKNYLTPNYKKIAEDYLNDILGVVYKENVRFIISTKNSNDDKTSLEYKTIGSPPKKSVFPRTTELDRYKIIQSPYINNVISWWKDNKQYFEILSSKALELLPINPNSVNCERLFSQSGMIRSSKRQNLDDDVFSKILFLKVNEKLV